MIKKMTSDDFNSILEESRSKIEKINTNIENIKNDIDKKTMIIKYENDYLNQVINSIELFSNKDKSYIPFNNIFAGIYDSYGVYIHPFYKVDPINVLNLKVHNDDSILFRDDVNVKLNDMEKEHYNNICKHDLITNKEIVFEEYQLEDGLLTLEVQKSNKTIGTSKFNMIELDTFLYRSFDIEKIEIYNTSNIVIHSIDSISKCGKIRIMLDKKYDLFKVKFYFKLKYSINSESKKIYPFGIKHLYFYECDFRNDSFAIIRYDSSEFIDNIKDNINLYTVHGKKETTLSSEGIKVYLDYNNSLENEQQPSTNIKKTIARNTRTLYLMIPLKNTALFGMDIFIENR